MIVASIITLFIIALAVFLGLQAGRKKTMTMEQWAVGGRNFGAIFLWLLLAGEIYTTFTFLGAAGYAYAKGGPVFYILGYGALGYVLSYFFLPPLWRYAKERGLVTQADYFAERFESPWLGALVALIGVVFMVPYTELQLLGLGTIVNVTTYGAVPSNVSMIISFALVAIFIYTSGLHATAWVSVLKDSLMVVAVLIVGIGLPLYYFGSFGNLTAALSHAHPGFLALPGGSGDLGVAWLMSTLVLTSAGFYMWPHSFAASYSAKSGRTIQKNSIFLPFYQLLLLLIFFVGFTAVLVIPGLKGAASNSTLLALVTKTFPPWIVGLIGGTGALAAIVPASLLLLQASTLLARNIYQGVINPTASPLTVHRLSRGLVLVVTAVALIFALFSPALLVNLLLTGYDGVSQFFPAVILSLFWRRVTKVGVASGVIVGVVLAMALVLTNNDPLWGMNAGFVALVVNSVVMVLVSLATYRATVPEEAPVVAAEAQG